MKYSEFRKLFDGKQETYSEFSVLLVEPDVVEGDDIDVQLTNLHDVLIDHDNQRFLFYSGAGSAQRTSDFGIDNFGSFIGALPVPEILRGDYELFIQLPLAEEDLGTKPAQSVPLAGVHVGVNSGEVWLLVRPISEHSAQTLPIEVATWPKTRPNPPR